ncbi:hypothetical protein AYO44_06095 [Planctomycetaceae bacterium SCGC AG-212-F19]|nr:hypothetical protein AYO44_06095 [Planctomycetaceae bacterium SCGC AG-212-F19]
MAEIDRSPKLTCGSIALAGVLALVVVVALQRQAQPPTWASTGAAAIAVVAVFLVARGVHHFGWGVVAAALLTFHPTWQAQSKALPEAVLAGADVLAVVAAACIGWRLAFHPRFGWRLWPVVGGAAAICIGLAWAADPHLGMLAVAVAMTSFWAGTFLGSKLRQRKPETLPAQLNLLTAGTLVLATPIAALVVYRFLDRSLYNVNNMSDLVANTMPPGLSVSFAAFDANHLASWCWPHPVLVLPFAVFALFMNVRRGWRQWSRAEAPTAWFLTILTLVILTGLLVLPSQGPAMQVILTALVVLLTTSMIADVLWHLVERLVLRPPDEREVASTESVKTPSEQPARVTQVAEPAVK